MIHIIKNLIQTETNLIDEIKGKLKEQIIISIALDDVSYEDQYIDQLESIKPFLSEIPFLEILIQKNLHIKFTNANKIAKYLQSSFFADIQCPSIKRIVFKDILHSAHGNKGAGVNNQQNLLEEFNYKAYLDWVLSFVGIFSNIGELDLNVNNKFLTREKIQKQLCINKIQLYIDYQTNEENIQTLLLSCAQNTLKSMKINIKENSVQIQSIFQPLYTLFDYIGKEQCSTMQEIILYNVFDDMISRPNISSTSFLSSHAQKPLTLLGGAIMKKQGQVDSLNSSIKDNLNGEINENKDVNSIKQQMTTKFFETMQVLKNLQKLVLNGYLLDLLCQETLKTLQITKQNAFPSRNISQQLSFRDIPLSNSHQSSQILDWNKNVSQDGSQYLIKINSQLEESKSLQNTPQSIKLTNEISNREQLELKKKKKSVFKSHAIKGMVFEYSSKIEKFDQLEKLTIKQNQKTNSKNQVNCNSIIELADTEASSNDSAKNTNNAKYTNNNGYCTPKKNSKEKSLPPFVLFPQQQEKQDQIKKYELEDIPYLSIDSAQPEEMEINKNQINSSETKQISPLQQQQQPTPVFGDIDPPAINTNNLESSIIKQRKASLSEYSQKESGFNLDSSISNISNISNNNNNNNNIEDKSNIIQHTEDAKNMKIENSMNSSSVFNKKEYEDDEIKQPNNVKNLSLSLKLDNHNRNLCKTIIEYLSSNLKEVNLSINDYNDSQWLDYVNEESFAPKKFTIQLSYQLMRTPPLRTVEAVNIFSFLREKSAPLTSLSLNLSNKKPYCPNTCQSLQDYIASNQSLKTFNFETCMYPSQMEFYKFLVCIAKSSIRHIEISGPKFEVLSDEAYLISPWKTYLSVRLRSLTIIGQNYSVKVLATVGKWKMLRLEMIHLSPTPTLSYTIQSDIIKNNYLFSFHHKNFHPQNIAHQCYDKIHTIIVQYTLFSKSFYSHLEYSPEITFWDLFFD